MPFGASAAIGGMAAIPAFTATGGSMSGLGGVMLGSAGISAGASLIGSLLGMASSSKMAHEQRKTMREYMKKQAEENRIAREWQERMSNTAHQREVDDLRAAGLNPILSATGGNGASTPTPSASIAGFNDSSAGLELQGKLKSFDLLVSIADRLSQIGLNSALSKKAESEALRARADVSLTPYKQDLLAAQRGETFSRSMLNTEKVSNLGYHSRLMENQSVLIALQQLYQAGRNQMQPDEARQLKKAIDFLESQTNVNSSLRKVYEKDVDLMTSQMVKNYVESGVNASDFVKQFFGGKGKIGFGK